MKETTLSLLPGLGYLRVTGSEAAKFLQGLVTCDVLALKEGDSTLGALCNRQGRVVFSFRLLKDRATYRLKMPNEMLARAQEALQKFAAFSKVELGIERGEEGDTQAWTLADMDAGLVTIYPETESLFLPQMLNYDKLGAVNFNKGCYLGQEIVARTQHLGTLKRHLYHAMLAGKCRRGEEIFSEGQVVGVVAACAKKNDKNTLLIVLQDTAAEKALHLQGALLNIGSLA